MIDPPFPFPEYWDRVYGTREKEEETSMIRSDEGVGYEELNSKDWSHRRDDDDMIRKHTKVQQTTENSKEDFVPIDLFKDGEWVEDPEDDEEGGWGIVLSKEWQKRFKRTAARRRRKELEERNAQVPLEGVTVPERTKRNAVEAIEANRDKIRQAIYGTKLDQIERLEIQLNATFDELMDKHAAGFWPAIPI